MRVKFRNFISELGDMFWIVPASLVLLGIFGAFGCLAVDRSGRLSQGLLGSAWLYNGGATGARTLLASSTIGVAGTVFSITIAALSLAAGQMGPRLLRNFVRDRGNQATLGIFLGTFAYALMVLRSVRTAAEGAFVPHLALTVAIALALLCVATLVYFVGHMAQRINVDVVIQLVSEDVRAAIARLTVDDVRPAPPEPSFWENAVLVCDKRRGYLQHVDEASLAAWALKRKVSVRLLVKLGDYLFPGAPVALVVPEAAGPEDAIREATALASHRSSPDDIEYGIRQLVEVAVRALSPGINDPHTAISVLDRLGAALCDLAGLRLPNGVTVREGRPCLVLPAVEYGGLTDAMFHLIRQNAQHSATVLIRFLEVLAAVASVERDPVRLSALRRHADLVLADGQRSIETADDVRDLRRRHAYFLAMTSGRAVIPLLAGR
jgi:uncharacterized membrane protein